MSLSKVKNKKNVKDELLYQIYKKPVEKINTVMEPVPQNAQHQYDLLFLPDDEGFKYCLVGVDIGTKLCDAEPIKDKESKTVLEAVKAIYDRGILSQPKYIRCDAGSEFKGAFSKFFKKEKVHISYAQPNRHRQVGVVECRNKSIGTYLMKRMVAQELKTKEKSTEWVEYLQPYVKALNKKLKIKPVKIDDEKPIVLDGPLLDVGDIVRIALDRPVDIVTGKTIDSKFRAGDPKFSIETYEIENIRLSGYNPPLYAIKGKTAMYTIGQLLPVNASNLPPDNTQSKFVVDKIVGKKKIKNKIHYQIKWKDHNELTWEPLANLKIDVPDLVKEYEKYIKQ